MKIAFYIAKHGGLYDKLISIATFSKYSHCEIIFNSGVAASSSPRDGGIRFKKIDFSNDRWDVFDLNVNIAEYKVHDWFTSNLGDKYDIVGAIASLFHIDLSSEDKKYCSQACAMALGFKDTVLTPIGLYKKLLQNNFITY